jgi:hypothetical protein
MTGERLAEAWHWAAFLIAGAVVACWLCGFSLLWPLAALFGWEVLGLYGHYWLRGR